LRKDIVLNIVSEIGGCSRMEMSEFRFALDALWNLIVKKKLFLVRFCELISRDIHEQLTCVGSQSVIQKPFGFL
jgi:hypothetical protein